MIKIDKQRLENNLKKLGLIGFEDGLGMNRPAYSANYIAARSFVEQTMLQAGMNTRVDRVGNLFGTLPGKNQNGKTILLGSHLDAVPGGGIYDGAMGVVGAIEAVQAIKEAGISLNHSLEVVGFTAEEGGDLGGTFGSRTFVGLTAGKTAPGILNKYELATTDLAASQGNLDNYRCYLELHIEQGPVLWKRQIPIGIPTAIVGITRYAITITGEANHAGTTPMDERNDAMRETAAVMTKWYDFATKQNEFVCNIGILTISPGTVTIIPEKVEFILEIRSTEASITQFAAEKFKEILAACCPGKSEMSLIIEKPPVKLDEKIIAAMANGCSDMGIQPIKMPSGASHDASPIAHYMPTGMIFVPSVKGISHARNEYTAIDDIGVGVAALVNTIFNIDRESKDSQKYPVAVC